MLPHEAAGGWMPRPRNDSDASARIAKATLSEAWTTIAAAALGSTWRTAMRQAGAPSARAASTYSRALMPSTWPPHAPRERRRVDDPQRDEDAGAAGTQHR